MWEPRRRAAFHSEQESRLRDRLGEQIPNKRAGSKAGRTPMTARRGRLAGRHTGARPAAMWKGRDRYAGQAVAFWKTLPVA
jgi:hypothetical protein